MAVTLHTTGKNVTVAKAESFGYKISAGYNVGGWFCFTVDKAANLPAAIKAAKKHFGSSVLVETVKERNARQAIVSAKLAAAPKRLTTDQQLQAAANTYKSMWVNAADLRDVAGTIMRNAFGENQTAHDYYELFKFMK